MPARKSIRVLIIDDDRAFTDKVVSYLIRDQRSAFTVDIARSYPSGLNKLAEERHDIYLINHDLSDDEASIALAVEALKIKPCPMVMLTGERDIERAVRSLHGSPAVTLSKEKISSDLLMDAIRDALITARTDYNAVNETETWIEPAHYDELTGLANRRSVERYINECFLFSEDEQKSFLLLYLDLDGFKEINHRHGRECGDLVLKECAERLSSMVRATDLVGRLDGDEFMVFWVSNEMDVAKLTSQAEVVANKFLEAFSKPFTVGAGENDCAHLVKLSPSISIALAPSDADSRRGLFIAADHAMAAAKQAGPGSVRFAGQLANATDKAKIA